MMHAHHFTSSVPARPMGRIERAPGYDLRAEQVRLLVMAGLPDAEIDRIMGKLEDGE